MISTSMRNGCFGKKVNFFEITCIFSLLPLKKQKIMWKTMQTIDLHYVQYQPKIRIGSFCDCNRLRGENFSFAKYRNRVILVNVGQLQTAITLFALDCLSQLGAQMKGICQPNPTMQQSQRGQVVLNSYWPR